ncbi:MAG: MBL fold metallo-hydrolase [Pseudomonadota bacterium]
MHALAPITPMTAVSLFDGIARWTAPNPGFMTGEGTNAYLIGRERLTLIDPGPVLEENLSALLNFLDDRLERILVTHTHKDHCPMAMVLADKTQVPVIGPLSPSTSENDPNFIPDEVLVDRRELDCDGITVEAIHTPGHASNHFCFWIAQHGVLLTGDHVMNGSTVVIAAPDGDMLDYLNSLRAMLTLPLQAIAPGHGAVIDNPKENIAGIIAHRLQREAKVIDALLRCQPCTLDELLPVVYDDVDPNLLPIARYSLAAHVDKLKREGRVNRSEVLALIPETA